MHNDVNALLHEERNAFHQELIKKGVLGFTVKENKANLASVPSNADTSSVPILLIAEQIMNAVLDESQITPRKPCLDRPWEKSLKLQCVIS